MPLQKKARSIPAHKLHQLYHHSLSPFRTFRNLIRGVLSCFEISITNSLLLLKQLNLERLNLCISNISLMCDFYAWDEWDRARRISVTTIHLFFVVRILLRHIKATTSGYLYFLAFARSPHELSLEVTPISFQELTIDSSISGPRMLEPGLEFMLISLAGSYPASLSNPFESSGSYSRA
ncbi:MAG: hypothetical protein Ct9H300mP27_03320 [Chloroflexota bacterium]|nr:MAG: hypothetical protein Ct9H300mP27_03320 [Chloroflexota bacterium]